MAQITLTDIPQSVPNSNIGAIIGSDGLPFLYGFGDTAPTNGIKFKEDDAGSIVYVDGARGDYLELLIQDNLSALSSFRVKVQGHIEGY